MWDKAKRNFPLQPKTGNFETFMGLEEKGETFKILANLHHLSISNWRMKVMTDVDT